MVLVPNSVGLWRIHSISSVDLIDLLLQPLCDLVPVI